MKKTCLFVLLVLSVTSIPAIASQLDSDSIFQLIGYASTGEGTSGGEGGIVDTIDNLADLETWASSREKASNPEIIYIKGKISSVESKIITIKHGENISIIGIDSNAELEHIGLFIWDYKNVIVRNLKIHEVLYPDDALGISECQYVWIDHCELYSKIGEGIGVDTYDGLLDIKKGSKDITVSWCYLHDHMKVCLIGHTDNESQGLIDSAMRITMHHNYFSNTDGRNPCLRFGAGHYFNNYCEDISDYGFAIRKRAHALIENNHYHNVNIPVATDKFDESPDQGFACLRSNIYSGSCSESSNSITRTDCDFWNNLPYDYSPEDASVVSAKVMKYSGVGKIGNKDSVPLSIYHPYPARSKFDVSEQNISVYPNPVLGNFSVRINLPVEGKIKIHLLDASGRRIAELGYEFLHKGKNLLSFTSQGREPGIYFITVSGNGIYLGHKLILQ